MDRRMFAALFSLIGMAFFLAVCVYSLHPFGVVENSPIGGAPMDDYIILNAQNETGTNNVVTSIVFDYRGFDTLGEETVLITAVAGVLTVFRRVVHG